MTQQYCQLSTLVMAFLKNAFLIDLSDLHYRAAAEHCGLLFFTVILFIKNIYFFIF